MRNTTHGTELIRNPVSGNIIGFSLGADFVAEHEWGIEGLKRKLGLPIKKILDNWEDMVINPNAANSMEFFEDKDYSVLRTKPSWETPIKELVEQQFYLKNWKKYDKERFDKTDFLSAWDSKDFIVVAFSEVARRNLKQLFEAFEKGNVVLSMMRSGMFRNGGISLSFNDRVPQQQKIDFNLSCEDSKNLQTRADATGIREKLEDNGKKFFALSPRWKDETKKDVVFWLNPYEQDRNNYGLFTVSDLEEWIANKGPIPKTKEQMNARY